MRTVLLLFVILVSCNSNHRMKAQIVERQKAISREIDSLNDEITRRHRLNDSIALAYIKDSAKKVQTQVTNVGASSETVSPSERIELLRRENDSLEIELKKY